MPDFQSQILTFILLLAGAVFIGIALRSLSQSVQARMGGVLGSLVQLALGLGALGLITYVVMYFLSLTGGFYESLTCKVVTLPSCEEPLALPTWLRLPEQSVGGVIGILPLLGIYLAKTLQGKGEAFVTLEDASWYVNAGGKMWHWLVNNASLLFVLFVELWLAALRGTAEAADRQVRISLGLDSELPAIYLSVARWGAVVLALGLSVVVIYLGSVGRYSRLLFVRGLAGLEYGAALVGLVGGLVRLLANALVNLWTLVAIAIGRFALKLQNVIFRLWALVATALGRFALKTQDALQRAWAFFATTLGWTVLSLRKIVTRRGTLESLLVLVALSAFSLSQAKTFVVLFDATGSEAGRLEQTGERVLAWADPSPQRSLLSQGDRLVVIPIQAPGNLDLVYSALFNATYPSSQLDRYAFFTELRDSLPTEVDSDPGTGLSDSLRAARTYLEDEDGSVLILFGNGEDHSASPITAAELAEGLGGSTVVHLNLGLDTREKWDALYREAGAAKVVLLDLAATNSLRLNELKSELE